MRKSVLLLSALFIFFSFGFSQNNTEIKLKQKTEKFEVTSKSNSGFTFQSTLSKLIIQPSDSQKGKFIQLSTNQFVRSYQKGNPELPVYSRLIEIPQDAEVKISIVSYNEEIIDLTKEGIKEKITPAQPSLRKDLDPADVPFYYNEKVYKTNEFFSLGEIAVFEKSGQMRDAEIGRIEVRPFQYNPVTNELKVLNNLVIKVEFKNADWSKTNQLKQKYFSPFASLPSSSFMYKLQNNNKELIQDTPITYVIVSDPAFHDALQPFVQWKTLKGFQVVEAYTDNPNVGNTVASIKAYLQDLYTNPPTGQNAPSFVLVVGDIDKVPATQHTEVADNPYSDLDLVEYTGDYLPEVNYGRWSADDATTVEHIVYKSIRYEKLEMDPSYLTNTFLLAGNDESHEDTYGGGAMWYGNEYYFNAAHNINNHLWLQDTVESWSGGNSAAHDSIIYQINNGVALANYTAHCSPDGWADPSFSRNDLNNYITNTDKYGLWIGNCCQSNKFDENEAFAELAIRKENAGVIGYIGGSQYTYWDGDYFWGVGVAGIVANPTYDQSTEGCYDGLFHDKANEINDLSTWFTSNYQFNKAGLLAVEASSATNKAYYWCIYQVAGDPSIISFVGTPQPMTVTPSPATLMLGMTSLDVSSAPYSYVALSQNGTLIAAVVSDASGNASLTFASDALSVGDADLVVTAQNRVPYIGTIGVSPADEPYVVLNSYTTSTSPNYGQTVSLNVTLENVANSGSGYDALNTNAVLSLSDSYITIVDGTEDYGTITAGTTKNIDNAFSVTIADNVPDQYTFSFNLTITGQDGSSNNYTWPATLNMTANAPAITIGDVFVTNDDNADGRLDPGETGDINFTVTNSGHADADFGGTLSESSDPNNYLTLGGTTFAPVTLTASSSQDFTFTGAAADINTPLGSPVGLQLDVAAGASAQYTDVSNQDLIIGIVPIYPISDEGTLSVCTGTFYDSGLDTAQYGNNEDYSMTFLPGSGEDFVVVDFTAFDIEDDYDFLYAYDGPDASYPQVEGSPFTGTTSPGTLTGANGLTFNFTSDNSVTHDGWVAEVSCFTPTTPPDCPVNPVPADAATNVFPVQISWDASFGATSYDVYFGTDADPYTNTPVTVTSPVYNISVNPYTTYYWAVLPTNSVGTGSACSVWSFTTGAAQYMMTNGATVTTCDGIFYDEGGPDNNYSSNLDQTMTFMPGTTGKMISADFISFETESGYDDLKIYDGTSASSSLIGDYEGTNNPGIVTADNIDGALTFVFHSDGSVTKAGWEANISCVDGSSDIHCLQNGIFSIIPNPNNGLFTIKTEGLNRSDYRIEIYSVSGRKMYQRNINSSSFDIDLGHQAKGIYFIKITSGNQVFNSKLIIK